MNTSWPNSIFNPIKTGGGVKFTWPTQNFNFQWETALQTPQKPPDFLYFDLTDPMVPNLANVNVRNCFKLLKMVIRNFYHLFKIKYFMLKESHEFRKKF